MCFVAANRPTLLNQSILINKWVVVYPMPRSKDIADSTDVDPQYPISYQFIASQKTLNGKKNAQNNIINPPNRLSANFLQVIQAQPLVSGILASMAD